jgi:hypothetical protein
MATVVHESESSAADNGGGGGAADGGWGSAAGDDGAAGAAGAAAAADDDDDDDGAGAGAGAAGTITVAAAASLDLPDQLAILPDELVGVVASFLPLRDVLACRLVCSRWAACIDAAPTVWKQLFFAAFPRSHRHTHVHSLAASSPAVPAPAPAPAPTPTPTPPTHVSGASEMLRPHTGHDNDNRTEGTGTRSPPLPKRKSKLAGGSVPLYRAAFFAECKLIARWRAGRPWTQSLNPPLRYAHVDSIATAEAAAVSSHDPHDASAYRAFIGVRGSVLVTSHGDGTVRMHNLETNGQVDMSTVPPRTVMARHSDRAGAAESVAVVSLAAPDDVDGDGPAHVWTGGMDSSVCVWDLKRRTRVVRIADAHPSPVLCMHGCDGAVITGSLCGSVRLWTGPSLDESTTFSEVRVRVLCPAHSLTCSSWLCDELFLFGLIF